MEATSGAFLFSSSIYPGFVVGPEGYVGRAGTGWLSKGTYSIRTQFVGIFCPPLTPQAEYIRMTARSRDVYARGNRRPICGRGSALGRPRHEQRVRLRNLGRRMERVKLEPGFRGSEPLCGFPASPSLSPFLFRGAREREGEGVRWC
jgi:hypothetical protein